MAKNLPSGKACGPDGVPNEVLACIVKHRPSVLLEAFNTYLRKSFFPSVWKEVRLVLLYKGAGKDIKNLSSFRQISMLNTAGKTLERLLLAQLDEFLDDMPFGRSDRLFGFRKGTSTTYAISTILCFARNAARRAAQNRDICALLSLDVQNAFNMAPWL